MGAVRTYQWSLTCPATEALPILRSALEQARFAVPYLTDSQIQGRSKTSWTKNRYSATVTGTVSASFGGSMVSWTVEMAGNKHDDILREVAVELPAGVLDDRGVSAALRQLGNSGSGTVRREVARLPELLAADEQVIRIGQGSLGRRPGIVVLTNRRLFFLAVSAGLSGDSFEQFELPVIRGLSISKERGGDGLVIAHTGGETEIKQLDDGQAVALVSAFDDLQNAAEPDSPAAAAADPVEQLQQLNRLHDTGLITDEEFTVKRAVILDRL